MAPRPRILVLFIIHVMSGLAQGTSSGPRSSLNADGLCTEIEAIHIRPTRTGKKAKASETGEMMPCILVPMRVLQGRHADPRVSTPHYREP